jgi:predicted secreted Zn-dependent protease
MAQLEAAGQIEEGESLVRLVWAEALEANGRHDEAREAIGRAHARLMERAAKIGDEALRASFLERVAENARTLELAAAWA